MRLSVSIVSALALLATAVLAAEEKAKSDTDAIQGTWKVVSQTDDGTPAPEAKIKGMTFTFKGDKVTVNQDGEKKMEGTIKMHGDKSPKRMDADFGEDHKGKAIYKLDGNKLTIAHGKMGDEPPTNFSGKTGSLTVLERAKDK